MTTEDFIPTLSRDISTWAADLIIHKPEGSKYLNDADMKTLSASVADACQAELGSVPQQVIIVCKLAQAVLAPTNEKTALLREVLHMSRGLSGVASIISAVGTALGWSGSAIAIAVAYFTGASLLGLVSLSAVLGWFFIFSPPARLSERALNVLQQGLRSALQHETANHRPQA